VRVGQSGPDILIVQDIGQSEAADALAPAVVVDIHTGRQSESGDGDVSSARSRMPDATPRALIPPQWYMPTRSAKPLGNRGAPEGLGSFALAIGVAVNNSKAAKISRCFPPSMRAKAEEVQL
jgi:hypothetical protein